jgi:proline dehydrogenase
MSLVNPDRLRTRMLDALLAPQRRDVVARSRVVTAARDRFVSGESVDEAVVTAAWLRRTNRLAALHPLLPVATDAAGVEATVAEAVTAIERVAPVTSGGDYRSEIYLAPEHLGLGSDAGRAAEALHRICVAGTERLVDVTLRSGPHEDVDALLDLVERTRQEHPRLTTSLVARRHRSEADALALAAEGARVRLVRGGTGEPRAIAWQDPHEVDLAFARCLATLLGSGVHTVVATHEPVLLDLADGLADQSGRGPEGLEYQFFLGADPDLQLRTADAGHRVRVLVPYGPGWLDHLHDLARRPSGVRRLVETLSGRA